MVSCYGVWLIRSIWMIHPIKRSSGPTPNPRTHTTQQIENVRKQLGTLVQALKGGLGGRKPKLDRQRRAKPAAQARQQGGMVRVGSALVAGLE